ncbi:hypothetical protein ACFQ0G_05335 [Streptomyces chiangmaiensis]
MTSRPAPATRSPSGHLLVEPALPHPLPRRPRAQHDIGPDTAVEDYVANILSGVRETLSDGRAEDAGASPSA